MRVHTSHFTIFASRYGGIDHLLVGSAVSPAAFK